MPTQTQSVPVPGAPEQFRQERLWPYLFLGVFLGLVFTRAEVISWFRIQ
jgi:hypothetical protein